MGTPPVISGGGFSLREYKMKKSELGYPDCGYTVSQPQCPNCGNVPLWSRLRSPTSAILDAANISDIELTLREKLYLEWLAQLDDETVEVFIGLFRKLRFEPEKKV